MKRERIALTIYVDLDPVPGTFNTQDSAREQIEAALRGVIPHYNPRAYEPGFFGAVKEENLIQIARERRRVKLVRSLAAFSNVDA